MFASFLLGVLGSLGHCVGMCSGVVLLFDRQPAFQNKFAWLLAHAGRITTYALLGLGFGGFGQTLWGFEKLQASLSVLVAILAFYMASAFMGLIPSPERLFSPLTQRWGVALRAFRGGSWLSPYLLGLLWGLLPCGLVLTALVAAMSTANASLGAISMTLFGVATVPSLFAVKWLAAKSQSRTWSRGLASLVMMILGFQFAMRGFASLGVVGHFMIGEVMFW